MPSDRRLVLLAVVAGVVALVLAGRFLRGRDATSGAPLAIPAVAVSTPAVPDDLPVTIDIVGAVRHPGVFVLPVGSRARDALKRAGGPLRAADLSAVNLAVRLADGELVVIPRRGATAAVGAVPGAAGGPGAVVHLNSATADQLETLDGIGPSLAARIVAWRAAHGGFHSVDDLGQVPGIGPARLEALRGHVAP
jgi:competence protein ComEA